MRRGIWLLAVLAAAVSMGTAEARTIRIPEETKNLEWALNEASYGDTILVGPGSYNVQERLRSGVQLISVKGPDSTTLYNRFWYILQMIDCDIETRVSGFTFDAPGCNVALACTLGAPFIENNVIRDAFDGIGLIRCNATVRDNHISSCNRGIHMDTCDPEVVENNIERNAIGISMISSSPVIARCRFDSNRRTLMIFGHSYPTIGGSLDMANDFLGGGFKVYNEGLQVRGAMPTDTREVAVATHNYWGSNCPDEKYFRGLVVYEPWTDAGHDTLLYECPETEAAEETAE
jgi:hypothetical protein